LCHPQAKSDKGCDFTITCSNTVSLVDATLTSSLVYLYEAQMMQGVLVDAELHLNPNQDSVQIVYAGEVPTDDGPVYFNCGFTGTKQ